MSVAPPREHDHLFRPDLSTLSDFRGARCREVCYCGRDRWVDVKDIRGAESREAMALRHRHELKPKTPLWKITTPLLRASRAQ